MAVVTTIDPVTRLEGHLEVTVKVDLVGGVQQVVDATATGTLFRGFESILRGRAPEDAEHITQRICGVCPVAHGMASVLAMEDAFGVQVPRNARLLRNLVNGANFVQSHLLHFYHLAVPDYVAGPTMPPWEPSWAVDRRIDSATSSVLVNHYVQALDMTRKAHEMGAVFGGRMPCPPTYVCGGFSSTPTAARIAQVAAYLNELIPFITDVYLPDVELLASVYSDYYALGGGYGNLLAFGVFELDDASPRKLLRMGRANDGMRVIRSVDVGAISEHVTRAWYDDRTDGLPPAAGQTVPQYPKAAAYSWLKAPRYNRKPYETGPLARMWVNGDYRRGISVMDRHAARAQECLKIATAMRTWLAELEIGAPVWTPYVIPNPATGVGLTEAPRGALGHWLQVTDRQISHYQIITPTCWNASPRDAFGKRGPLEQALLGTPVRDPNQPIEVVRVIHSFDPCLSCAVHVMRAEEGARIFRLDHYHGPEDPGPEHSGHEHSHPAGEHSHHQAAAKGAGRGRQHAW